MFRLLVPLILLSVLCGGCSRGWSDLRVDDVSYADLFDLTTHVIDGEGFDPVELDRHNGMISTGWNYKKFTTVGRIPVRRRLETTIDPEGEGGYLVRLRIDQEQNRRGFRLSELERSEGWEESGWDIETALLILKKIEIQLKESGPSREFEDRYRKAEGRKARVPDALR